MFGLIHLYAKDRSSARATARSAVRDNANKDLPEYKQHAIAEVNKGCPSIALRIIIRGASSVSDTQINKLAYAQYDLSTVTVDFVRRF